MFDIGWGEMLIVVAVAVLVIGPKDIPKVMMMLGRVFRRMQYVRFALSQQFEDLMKEHDLHELRDFNHMTSKSAPETNEAEADEDSVYTHSIPSEAGGSDQVKPSSDPSVPLGMTGEKKI